MAFTKQPVAETYQTKRIDLVSPLLKRGTSVDKDNDYLNCFFDVLQNKSTQDHDIHVVKRPGTADFTASVGSTNIRGVFHWDLNNLVYIVSDNDITIVSGTTGSVVTTLSNVLGTSSGAVGFTTFNYDDNSVKVIISDGTTLATIDSSHTFTASADGDLPSPHIPQPVFLDGYIFLVKSGTADIYNSNLNDPLAWTPGDFLSCEMFPDGLRGITKLNNYLLGLGVESIEYFWDAANASGSPLQRNDTPIKLVGYQAGLAQHGNMLYYVGRTYEGTLSVYQLEDFKIKEIGTPAVRKFLEALNDPVNSITGTIVSADGHDFYILVGGSYTYVYDVKTELWSRWAYQSGDTFAAKFAFINDISNSNCSILYISGQNKLVKLVAGLNTDSGTNYTFRLVTDNEYFDSYNQKTMNRATVLSDQVEATATLQWSDDDYQSFNTGHTINLDLELPATYRLGRFRRRAFKLSITDDVSVRIHGLEVDINLGQH